ADLGDETRFNPMHAFLGYALGQRNGGVRPCDCVQPLLEIDQTGVVEAGADPPGIAKFAARVVIPEQQRAKADALSAWIGEADDQELIGIKAFDLQPLGAAARSIGLVGALRDNAFDFVIAGVAVEIRTAS